MEDLQLQFLAQSEDFISPFPFDEDGFCDSWWHRNPGWIHDNETYRIERFQLLSNGTELGHAEIMDAELDDNYDGLDVERTFKEISFFEIRASHRRKGLGATFVDLLLKHYGRTAMIAFSEEADDFWSAIGWEYVPRNDGDVTSFRKLFASESKCR